MVYLSATMRRHQARQRITGGTVISFCFLLFAEDDGSAACPFWSRPFHHKPDSNGPQLLLPFYQNLQIAFLAISIWVFLNNIFCSCLLAFERLDFDVPVEISRCLAISS